MLGMPEAILPLNLGIPEDKDEAMLAVVNWLGVYSIWVHKLPLYLACQLSIGKFACCVWVVLRVHAVQQDL